MKIQTFGVTYWSKQSNDYKLTYDMLNEHHNRIQKYISSTQMFYAPGSYSNPYDCPVKNVDVIQIGIENTKPYSRDWNYFHVGFMTGIYHALLNTDFDVLVHVQDRTLIGINLLPIISEFMSRKEIICAPKYTSLGGTSLETGLMIMKPEAVKIYATQHKRISLSDDPQMNVEEEAFGLFWDKWWNPWPHVSTIRQYDVIRDAYNAFNLDESHFLQLPFIAAGAKHCDKDLQNKWINNHV